MNKLAFLKNNAKTISEHIFNVQPQGYDCEEIDIFLDSIINDYLNFEKYILEKNDLIENLKKENAKLIEMINKNEIAINTTENKIKSSQKDLSNSNNLAIFQKLNQLEKNIFELKDLANKISTILNKTL